MRHTGFYVAWVAGVVGRGQRPVTTRLNMWERYLTSVNLMMRSDPWFIIHVCHDVAPGCLFIGYRWDLTSKTLIPLHMTYATQIMGTTHFQTTCFKCLPSGPNSGRTWWLSPGLDAVTYQTSFPG
jgi:hypothetical protein